MIDPLFDANSTTPSYPSFPPAGGTPPPAAQPAQPAQPAPHNGRLDTLRAVHARRAAKREREFLDIGRRLAEEVGDPTLALLASENRTLPITILVSDRRIQKYQRALQRDKVDKYARDFDPGALGRFAISQHADGTYWLIDGQHRREAMRKIGWWGDDYRVECVVYRGLTYQQEAALFRKLNDQSRLTTGALFNASLEAAEAGPTTIAQIVESLGLHLNTNKSGRSPYRSVRCVATLERIFTRHGADGLRERLALIVDTWQGDGVSFDGQIVAGVDAFVTRYSGIYQRDRFVAKLSKVPPVALLRDQLAARSIIKQPVIAMAHVLRLKYTMRAPNSLPPWDERDEKAA